ncbi:MAG: hypothetical protein CM1200mP2_10260 [Planctomycetaceae bacterium]|nr:MAG: hypothetical protein CM1200mP2_10260 [Planctomycetaceae bacterium]
MAILAASAPCLVLMGLATGWFCLVSACSFAFIHFMTQPVYNSLIAQLVPSRPGAQGTDSAT